MQSESKKMQPPRSSNLQIQKLANLKPLQSLSKWTPKRTTAMSMSKRKVRWPALRSVLGPILSCFLPGLFSQSKIILFLRLYWCKLIWQIPTAVAFPCSIVRVISPLLCLFKNPFKSVSFLARTRCFAFSRILRHNADYESSPRSRIWANFLIHALKLRLSISYIFNRKTHDGPK